MQLPLAVWLLAALGLTVRADQYNCSHKYVLSSLNYSYGGEQCLSSVPPPTIPVDEESGCSSLHYILWGYNSVIGYGDCLELQFTPGEYWFSSQTELLISYSTVLTAPWGGVSMTCNEAASESGSIQEDSTESLDEARVGPRVMMAFSQTIDTTQVVEPTMFVAINSISFSNCPKRLQFNSLNNVTIVNSSFKNFSSSALDFLNVSSILLKDSSFTRCVSREPTPQFRANGGAVSVAYYYKTSGSEIVYPILDIQGCTFANNSVFISSPDELNQALINNTYSGRGGGLSLIIQGTLSSIWVGVRDTNFTGNWAEAYGGGFYVLISGGGTSHSISVDGCWFLNNYGGQNGFGGGLIFSLLLRNKNSRHVKVRINQCYFEDNIASNGAGLSIIEIYSQGSGNELNVYDSRFARNKATGTAGSVVLLQTFSYVQNRLKRMFYSFTNCFFHDNFALGGTFGAGFNSINFFGNTTFSNNFGPGLRLVGTFLSVQGNLTFIGNSVPHNVEGSALFIQAFGQVELHSGASMNFIDNTGVTGAAIVVDVQRSSPVFSELIYNPQCFLIYEDPILQPSNWEDVTVRFSGNRANVGPALLISHLQHCSWYESSRVLVDNVNNIDTIFSVKYFVNWTVFDYDGTNEAFSQLTDVNNPRFYFQTQLAEIVSSATTLSDLSLRPGEVMAVDLDGQDQFGNPTYFIARVLDGRLASNLGAFRQATNGFQNILEEEVAIFNPSLLSVTPAESVANLKYGFDRHSDSEELSTYTIPIAIDTPFYNLDEGVEMLTFNLTLSHCRPGYELALLNSIYTCACSTDNIAILTCDDDQIILRDGVWVGKHLDSDPHLDIAICPVPYCQCKVRGTSAKLCENAYFTDGRNDSDQCHPTRRGTLCGECVNGTAVGVLRTNCRTCSRNNYYTLALLILGDVLVLGAIFFALMKLDFHFPHSLKGLLFYIQTAYYVTESFPASFWDIRKYMLYTSSALSLYYPYDFCLSPDMDALTATGLKFIPPFVAIVISLSVIIGVYANRSHVGRAGRPQVWRAVWFLLLLFYAPLLHTCIVLLNCPIITSADGDKHDRRWFLDGEVECFQTPRHIGLGVVAIVVLILLVLLIPVTFFFTISTSMMKEKPKSRTVEWISLALGEGYRDALEARCYAAWELTRRLLLIFIVVALPGRSVASAYVIITSFTIHVFFNPYQKILQNVLEMLVLLNYIVFLLVRSNDTILDSVSGGYYSGNQVPDSLGDSLPPVDNVAWLFIPPFYFPLVFAVIFSVGALAYRITKSLFQWEGKKTLDHSSLHQSHYFGFRNNMVSTTLVDAPN